MGVDACPGVQALKDRNRRRIIGCKNIGVAQSKVGGWRVGRGVGTWQVMGKIQKTVDGGVRVIKT